MQRRVSRNWMDSVERGVIKAGLKCRFRSFTVFVFSALRRTSAGLFCSLPLRNVIVARFCTERLSLWGVSKEQCCRSLGVTTRCLGAGLFWYQFHNSSLTLQKFGDSIATPEISGAELPMLSILKSWVFVASSLSESVDKKRQTDRNPLPGIGAKLQS
ncbi:hypothetical protein NPIL_510641 [Nephila pilipes]|uniref:Uncharacterized protein n=1 Tax=Nephila pilipes TaxID=299642 RepID=A0A8X6UBD8_NEPPI|nr:hypothetical protein NPIL_510641 [Nephila pilipes]